MNRNFLAYIKERSCVDVITEKISTPLAKQSIELRQLSLTFYAFSRTI